MSSLKFHPFCLGLNVLTIFHVIHCMNCPWNVLFSPCALNVTLQWAALVFFFKAFLVGGTRYFIILLSISIAHCSFNTLRLKNGRYFSDDIFKCVFLNENIRISTKISLKFYPRNPIDNNSALVRLMAWCLVGHKPLPEPMITKLHDATWRHYNASYQSTTTEPCKWSMPSGGH